MTDAEVTEMDAWAEVSARIVQGITHEINNRLVSLMGAADLMSASGPDTALLELLRGELSRLDSANRLLRQLVAWDPRVEVVPLASLLEEVLALHQRHRGLERVSLQRPALPAAAPAVEAATTAIQRGLLILLARAAEASDAPLVLEAGPGPGELRLAAALDDEAIEEAAVWLERGRAVLRREGAGLILSFRPVGP